MGEIEFYTIQGSKNKYIYFLKTHTHTHMSMSMFCKSMLQYMFDHKGHNTMSHTL
jgi:hypothetical protein